MKQASVIDNRIHAVALMAVLHEGDEATHLADFMGEGESELCRGHISRLIDSIDGDRQEVVGRKIKALVSSEKFNGIAEIHPHWILEALKNESPRIMGIIMRYLPSKQVRYVLENLPPDLRKHIPTLVEAFAVPQHILRVIKSRFESRFLPMQISKVHERFDFGQLYYLKGEEIERLCIELGIWELAMALSGVSKKMLGVVLNRLDLKEAKRLHQRIQEVEGVSKELRQQARYAVLETEGEHIGSKQLLMEIGIRSLARSMSKDDDDLFMLIKQKLSPHVAYTMKRAIDELSESNSPSIVEERRNIVLKCVSQLAEDHKIDTQWVRFAPEETDS